MGEFHEHHRQKLERHRYLPLCAHHVAQNLVTEHRMLSIAGFGDECVWCGTDDEPKHTPADYLVDMQIWPREA